MWNYLYLGVCLSFSILLMLFFKSKERIASQENKFFEQSMYISIFSVSSELILQYLTINFGFENIFMIVFSKIYLISLIIWFTIFSKYIFYIFKPSEKDEHYEEKQGKFEKKYFVENVIHNILLVIFVIICIALPIEYYKSGSLMYSFGPAVDFLRICLLIFMISWVVISVKNYKHIYNIKYLPILIVFILLVLNLFLQKLNPALLIGSFTLTFLSYIMYFTIENPDVKMIQQLEVAKEQADKANHAKTDFLSSMSHEIRTPLNAIVGFSDCIMDAQDLGEAKENAKDIVNASQTLLEIVNGILDISKIEAGKLEIVNSSYDAPGIFLELAKLITPKMNEKGLDFTYKIAPDLPKTLYGDHANLKKIVTNLLSNACKYTERGYVHYEVNCINTPEVSKLIISVEDSGRGIKKESIDKMFTKFQRLDEDRNTTIEGTGLGLAITKQLIELMGGKIIVHTVYGEGSKFTVVLNQRIEKVELEEKHHVKTTLDLYNIRILLVDDTALNLKVACKLLERYNANQVVTCDSGFECLERIKRGEIYDLILLDDMMPKMSGVETLKKLKEIPGFRIPTVALTANAITGMREKYLNDGFDDYLAKPIEKEQLILVVNQILGRNITEEMDFSKEEKIVNYINGPVSPSVRGEEIPNVEDYEKAEEERNKNAIIPVEDNIETLLGESLNRNYHEEEVPLNPTPVQVDHIDEVEMLEDDSNEVVPNNILPVVDIDIPTETSEKVKVYDRQFLEENSVDVNHGLELLGDMDMYNDTISDFMSEVEDKWKQIVEYKETNNMPEYAILVHSLKSDCKYLGFMQLADISYQHELKSKENDSEFVRDHFAELEEEYKKVLEVARTYVEHLEK